MTQDDRMETITDPAAIRASDEPDERTPNEVHVDESGCSCKTGPYRGFQRDPIDAACPKHGGPLRHGDGDVTVCHPDGSTTIIREPDERGDFPCCADRAHKESLGGDSESGTYNRSSRPPAGPRPDADNPWALLPDDHPKRPKQCGGCGTKWVDAELLRACERRHGDDITAPAPVGAAVALDLDAVHETICDNFTGMAEVQQAADLLVAEVRRLTHWQSEALPVMVGLQDLGSALGVRLGESITGHAAAEAARALTARAEAAEAEVGTLRAKVAAVEGLAERLEREARNGYAARLRAALATTGEGE